MEHHGSEMAYPPWMRDTWRSGDIGFNRCRPRAAMWAELDRLERERARIAGMIARCEAEMAEGGCWTLSASGIRLSG